MSDESQRQRQTRAASRKLSFPVNFPLLINGILRRHEDGFVLEMSDFDQSYRPVMQPIPIAEDDDDLQARLEEYCDQAVTLQGRWLPDPNDSQGCGRLLVTTILP